MHHSIENKLNTYKAISIIGLIMIALLQSIWVYNTYSLMEKEFRNKINKLFYSSINDDIYVQFNRITYSSPLVIGEFKDPNDIKDKNGVEIVMSDFLEKKLHIPLSMQTLDSAYSASLKKEGIKCQYKLQKFNPKTQKVFSLIRSNLHSLSEIKTTVVPIRKDKSLAVQAVIMSPYKIIFEHMALLLISTVLLFILVIYCIAYQIQIIIRQNKISRLREDFSYAMIHDMKTPINTIIIGTRILHSGRLENKPEKKEKHFSIINEELKHLLTLINQILTISKLENGKLELNKQCIPLQPMINSMVETFKVKADKNISFNINLKADNVYADKEYLKEALENLIDNALKYSKSEGVNIDISSTNDEVIGCTTIHVKDNGLGMTEDDQKIIFDKFERASAVRRTSKGGATGFGLGLNYVYQVMKAHGGSVEVNSKKGEYSEFILFFPNEINKSTENDKIIIS